jgi:hypothetical protein
MKALIISDMRDFRVSNLIYPLQEIMEVGIMTVFDENSVREFNPDIVFSSVKYKGAYDLSELHRIKPFINLNILKEKTNTDTYKSDVVYLGNTSIFPLLSEIYGMGYVVRQFDQQPSMTPYYSGKISINKCCDVYRSAKVSLVPKNDMGYRLLDIIVSDGNPLIYDERTFLEDCVDGIKGKKFQSHTNKDKILKYDTNYDRLSVILSSMGFETQARKVYENKRIS